MNLSLKWDKTHQNHLAVMLEGKCFEIPMGHPRFQTMDNITKVTVYFCNIFVIGKLGKEYSSPGTSGLNSWVESFSS